MAFKWWQIMVFALIPLALVFIGVIGGAFRGIDSEADSYPTPAIIPTPRAALPSEAPAIVVMRTESDLGTASSADRGAMADANNRDATPFLMILPAEKAPVTAT